MFNQRPILKDESQKTSPTNPNFLNRLQDAMTEDEIVSKMQRDAQIKSGKFAEENSYRGISASDTSVTRRLASVGNMPTSQGDRDKYYEGLGKTLRAEEAAKTSRLKRGWKTAEQELEEIQDRLGDINN